MNVINIKKENLKELGFANLEEWLKNEDHVYIGREMNYYVKGAKGSKWKNPFSVKRYGREKCLELYKQYVYDSGLIEDIEELEGKTLGCWCKPEKCHGDILFEILRGIDE